MCFSIEKQPELSSQGVVFHMVLEIRYIWKAQKFRSLLQPNFQGLDYGRRPILWHCPIVWQNSKSRGACDLIFPLFSLLEKNPDVALRFAENWALTSNRDANCKIAIRSGYLLACTASAAKKCGACYCHLKLDIFNMESERGLNSRRNSSQLRTRMVLKV